MAGVGVLAAPSSVGHAVHAGFSRLHGMFSISGMHSMPYETYWLPNCEGIDVGVASSSCVDLGQPRAV